MINRRTIITAALAATQVRSRPNALAQAAMSRITAYAFSFPALAGGDIRLADYAGHPLLVVNTASLVRLHAAICRIAGIVDRVSRSRPDDHRRSLQRFRRPGTGRRDRNRGDRTAPIWRHLSDRGKGRREGPECASRSTNGLRKRGRRMFRAGTFTNIWSAATATSPRCFPETVEPSDTRVKTAIARALADDLSVDLPQN